MNGIQGVGVRFTRNLGPIARHQLSQREILEAFGLGQVTKPPAVDFQSVFHKSNPPHTICFLVHASVKTEFIQKQGRAIQGFAANGYNVVIATIGTNKSISLSRATKDSFVPIPGETSVIEFSMEIDYTRESTNTRILLLYDVSISKR